MSWNKAENGDIEGRMVIDALTMNPDNRKADDPTMMRLDFNYTSAQKMGDMFLSFDEGNQWANGFRIKVIKDLSANSLRKVFVSQGLIDVKAQFLPGMVV